MNHANRRKHRDAIRDIVERVRSGDQVAMGLMATVRDNAKNGDPRAKHSLRAFEHYIRKHPPQSIGAEVSDITNPQTNLRANPQATAALWKSPTPEIIIRALPVTNFWSGVVALVHGPRLDDARINEIVDVAPETRRDEIKNGVRFWRKKTPSAIQDERPWLVGRIIGLARCIQRLQIPSVPISTFCPIAAWELGE